MVRHKPEKQSRSLDFISSMTGNHWRALKKTEMRYRLSI